MKKKGAQRQRVLPLVEEAGGALPGVSRSVAAHTGVPEADVFGVATFYDLLARPDVQLRVCMSTTCRLKGSERRLAEARAAGADVIEVSCLGQCDRAPVALDGSSELVAWGGSGRVLPSDPELPINLGGVPRIEYPSLAEARSLGAVDTIARIEEAGLQGRGGAGFPAHRKWSAVREAPGSPVVVVNADEGEPGTFKDREIMLRRPDRLLEGLAIAAVTVGAKLAYIYIRGEFKECRRRLEIALSRAPLPIEVRFVDGHGAYICGEETALLEAIEGRRGMPRQKPPYPTTSGLFGAPTLIHNVETLAMIPSIVARGGGWFASRGKTEPGTKLYCLSGDVQSPGVYELPLGTTLRELVEVGGGYLGTPKGFSPGGASSGVLPISYQDTPLDFGTLHKLGTMLGSAGVVVFQDTRSMVEVARWSQLFFEAETCGQCAPCRIGCSLQRRAVDAFLVSKTAIALAHVDEVGWEMEQGSICGLGMTASLPILSAMKHFPDEFIGES